MIIDHANRLHKRVTNRRADKFEAALYQILAHGIDSGVRAGISLSDFL